MMAAAPTRTWVLGASDPEMDAIKRLLAWRAHVVATAADGRRVRPETAYAATVPDMAKGTVWIECRRDRWLASEMRARGATLIDHHAPGDPGYGRPPADYMEASSLGQVLVMLRVEPTAEHRIIAAADHCLGAAYAGRCPGVSPGTLLDWRMSSRAEHQRRPVKVVIADVRAAIRRLRVCPSIVLGGVLVRDLRPGTLPELPDVCGYAGVAAVYEMPMPDGRMKVGIIGAGIGTASGPAPVEAWLRGEGPAAGLTGLYGDPARGYAGGYRR